MDPFDPILEQAGFIARHYLALAILAALAWAIGRRATARLRFHDRLEATLLSLSAGLGLLSTLLMLLALAGLFAPLWVGVALLLALALAWPALRRGPRQLTSCLTTRIAARRVLGFLVAAALLSPLLILPLYPPVEFDAVLFHLPFADAILASQGVEFFEHLRYPVFPALVEVLFALGMMGLDDLMPALVHFLCFALVTALAFHWGAMRASRRAGYLAALLWVVTPTALFTGVAPYVDGALTLFVTAGLIALERHHASGEPGWLALGGGLFAFAAATKYHGLFFLALFFAYLAYVLVRRRVAGQVAVIAALTVGLLLPWYGHITLRTGNPLFPFAPRTFGWTEWAFNLQGSPEIEIVDGEVRERPLEERFEPIDPSVLHYWKRNARINLPRLDDHLLDLVERPGAVGGRPLSPLPLLLLPLVAALALRSARARVLLTLVAAYFAFWALTGRDPRYLLPILPVWFALGSEALDRGVRWALRGSTRRLGRVLFSIMVASLLGLGSLASAEIAWRNRHLPIQPDARRDYLGRRLAAGDSLLAFNQRAAADDRLYVLFAEHLRHYVGGGGAVGDWFGPSKFVTIVALSRSPAALHAHLRELDVEYLFYPGGARWRSGKESDLDLVPAEELTSHFEVVHRGRKAVLLRLRAGSELGPASGSPG